MLSPWTDRHHSIYRDSADAVGLEQTLIMDAVQSNKDPVNATTKRNRLANGEQSLLLRKESSVPSHGAAGPNQHGPVDRNEISLLQEDSPRARQMMGKKEKKKPPRIASAERPRHQGRTKCFRLTKNENANHTVSQVAEGQGPPTRRRPRDRRSISRERG